MILSRSILSARLTSCQYNVYLGHKKLTLGVFSVLCLSLSFTHTRTHAHTHAHTTRFEAGFVDLCSTCLSFGTGRGGEGALCGFPSVAEQNN